MIYSIFVKNNYVKTLDKVPFVQVLLMEIVLFVIDRQIDKLAYELHDLTDEGIEIL